MRRRQNFVTKGLIQIHLRTHCSPREGCIRRILCTQKNVQTRPLLWIQCYAGEWMWVKYICIHNFIHVHGLYYCTQYRRLYPLDFPCKKIFRSNFFLRRTKSRFSKTSRFSLCQRYNCLKLTIDIKANQR